ncbi:hypothetical protein [Burkholderia sp. USMB20]|uniref:hypothetical protein n=1 Tax=Burkholderia sp. USMB20 TaxID=1571773 RepID=UPI000AFECDF2|nr:hypothetical protein [Burkholderia sp. USMB20]TGN93128.1 hypothetical protein PL79_031475 [Burkholderia sp. USMB20]
MADEESIDPNLLALCVALDTMATTIRNVPEQRQLNEVFGWNVVGVSRDDIVALINSLANRIRKQADIELPDDVVERIRGMTQGLNFAIGNTIPQVFSGNAVQAVPALLLLLEALNSLLTDALQWPTEPGLYAIPPQLKRRINAARTRVASVEDKTGDLETKVEQILAAHSAAESLDIDLAALHEARERTKQFEADARLAQQETSKALAEVLESARSMQQHQNDAAAVVEKCEDAYRIATSKGLAGAFDDRANKLNVSIRWWTGSLILTLAMAAVIGYERVRALNGLLSSATPTWGAIALHLGVSLVSVGAPFWFAWLATKQIGQRFRLAEDYAFKASVSKAYEGYRKEAVRIDPAFENRLFASTLSRIEEAPLRLLADEKNHGSPWHELVHSKAFEKAIELVPELRAKVIDIAGKSKAKAEPSDTEEPLPAAKG